MLFRVPFGAVSPGTEQEHGPSFQVRILSFKYETRPALFDVSLKMPGLRPITTIGQPDGDLPHRTVRV